MTANLEDLLRRVQAATTYSDELDDAIADTLGLWAVTHEAEDLHSQPHEVRRRDFYTDSIDDALALVDRLLPGTRLSMVHWNRWHAEFLTPDEHGEHWLDAMAPTAGVTGATLPLAILAALLTALVAQQKEAK